MLPENHIRSSPTGDPLPPSTGDPLIRYVRGRDIDLEKWETCMDRSPNRLIYGRSFYLDYMAGGRWDALVLGDYQAVMPLCYNTKWGIRYCYQPAFTQQLGIFASSPAPAVIPSPAVTPPIPSEPAVASSPSPSAAIPGPVPSPAAALVPSFLHALHQHFRFAEIFLNHACSHPSLSPQTNLVLSLDAPYSTLAAAYKKDLVKNLRLATRSGLQYGSGIDLQAALGHYKDLLHGRIYISKEMYERFENLCCFLQKKDQLLLRTVRSAKGDLLALAVLPMDAERMYLLASIVLPEGRGTAANHFLLDSIIKEFAGRPLILDFEGSELPGIIHFYSNFGAVLQSYFFYRHNGLPWPLKLIKPS